ncbi:hypothetical protein NCC49_004597 [Naganishia albida]|nr:hypothetical protein NCC49_004597 [Naganishia albida]
MEKRLAGKKNGGSGKKGVGKKLNDGGVKLELKPMGYKTPQLPVKIYAVIAEHLIGQHAFRTTASLNAVSRAVHEETLPILYETFFVDEYEETIPEESRGVYLPDGIRFTKYLFCTTEHDDNQAFPQLERFTNIVMSICVDVNKAGDNMGDLARDHHWCNQTVHLMSLMGLTDLRGDEDPEFLSSEDIPMTQECKEQVGKPAVRPVSNIRRVSLIKGSYLHDHPPIRLPRIKTNLRLHDLEIKVSRNVPYDDIVGTALELMKLAAMQVNAKNLAEAEKKLVPELGFGIASLGPSTCILRLKYEEWHINLVMTMAGAKRFIDKLRVDAEVRPKILLTRLHLTITGDVVENDFYDFLAEMHKLYATRITGMHLVLPTRSDPPEVARCEVVGADKAVKMSGTVQVVPRKRGVLVKLKVDRGAASRERGDGAYSEEIQEK